MYRMVTRQDDQFAVDALEKLKKERPSVEVVFLKQGEYVSSRGPRDVAVFTLNGGNEVHFPGRHARLAVHRLLEAGVVPEWACPTPYVVALRKHPNEKTRQSIRESVKFLADSYSDWFAGRKSTCPWGCEPTGDSLERFKEWQKSAFGAEDDSEKAKSFFANLEPLNARCLQEISNRLAYRNPMAVSALCLHSDQERNCIVNELDPQVQQAAVTLVEELPLKEVDVYTFHPDDIETLDHYDLQDLVLSTLRDNKEEFDKHWELSSEFARMSNKILLLPLKKLFENSRLVDSAWKTARSRAREMAKSIMKNPPPIFARLTPEEQRRRVAREAVLYLLMTAQYSDSVYLGLEVHSGYWRAGELYHWGDAYLPVNMVPSCLRQHWAPWAVGEERIQQISKLGLL